MKKFIPWVVALCLVVGIVLFRNEILTWSANAILKTTLPRGWKGFLSYGSSSIENRKLILTDVLYYHPDGIDAKVEELQMGCRVSFSPFSIKPLIRVVKPDIIMQSQESHGSGFNFYKFFSSSLFKHELDIEKGYLHLGTSDIGFSYKHGQAHGELGCLNFSEGNDPENQNHIALSLHRVGKEINADVRFDNASLEWLFPIMKMGSSQMLNEWKAKKGILKGKIQIGMDRESHISRIVYRLTTKDALFVNKSLGYELQMQRLELKEHFTSMWEMGKLQFHPFFHQIWPFYLGEGNLSGAKLTLQHSPFQEIAFHAGLSYNERGEPQAQLDGILKKDGRNLPLQARANGEIVGEMGWKVSLSLTHDQLHHLPASLSCFFYSHGDRRLFIQGESNHLTKDHLILVKEGLHKPFQELAKVDLMNGEFSGKLKAFRENGCFKKIEFEEARMTDLALTWEEKELFARELGVHLKLNLDAPELIDGCQWYLTAHGGHCKNALAEAIEDVEVKASGKGRHLQPFNIKGRIGEIALQSSGKGHFHALTLETDFHGKTEDIFHLVGLKQNSWGVAEEQSWHLKTLIERGSTSFEVRGDLSNKEQSDLITFSWQLPHSFKEFGTISFHGKELSSETVNIALCYSDEYWRAGGTWDVQGTVNQKEMQLKVTGEGAQFLSAFMDADLGPMEKPAEFNFDRERNYWRGKLKLYRATLHEKRFGLTFSDLSSRVIFEGKKIFAQELYAQAEGISCQGDVNLEFVAPLVADFELTLPRLEGEIASATKILKMMDILQTIPMPQKGRLFTEKEGLYLATRLGSDEEEEVKWKLGISLSDGAYHMTQDVHLDHISCDFAWNSMREELHFHDLSGDLILSGLPQIQGYTLNGHELSLTLGKKASYDVRLESHTHDVFRVVGTATHREEQGFDLDVDPKLSHLFGSRLAVNNCTMTDDFALENMELNAKVSAHHLLHYIDILHQTGVVSKQTFLEKIKNNRMAGEIDVAFLFHESGKNMDVTIKSETFSTQDEIVSPFHIYATKKGRLFRVNECEIGDLQMAATFEGKDTIWEAPKVDILWKGAAIKASHGYLENRQFHLNLDEINLDVEPFFQAFLEKMAPYAQGNLSAQGHLYVDLRKGLQALEASMDVDLHGDRLSKANLEMKSTKPIHLQFTRHEDLLIENLCFKFRSEDPQQQWAKCKMKKLCYSFETEGWKGEKMRLEVTPEMFFHLAQHEALPNLKTDEDKLQIFGFPMKWENQLSAILDFDTAKGILEGGIKDGYYWVGKKTWHLKDFSLEYQNERIHTHCKMHLHDHPFEAGADMFFGSEFLFSIFLQEEHVENKDPLRLKGKWDRDHGLIFQSIEGNVCGLDCSFHHYPRETTAEDLVLTGQVKIDAQGLSPLIPIEVQDYISKLSIGRGFEVGGNMVFSRDTMRPKIFRGYLKGKSFEMMGSHLQTLFGGLIITPDHVEITDLKMSDQAGVLAIPSIDFACHDDDLWHLSIPSIQMHDFRPSVLNKIGRYRGRIKPFVVRELYFDNIEGVIGKADTFQGHGELRFVNSFKRDLNLFDIPKEIIARLGIDMGLLIPVRGRLSYRLEDGKILLTELKECYSESKRSNFYLSPNSSSYIDFDGDLHINIKMKQYVLLKITELFTLSVRGRVDAPKYSLK